MAKKTNRRTKLTEKAIREAFLALLLQKPFSQITVKDICSLADLNRTTFYLHYPNLEVLLDRIEQTAYKDLEDFVRSVRSKDDKKHQLTLLMDHIKENQPLFQILLLSRDRDYRDRLARHFLALLTEEKNSAWSETGTFAVPFIIGGCMSSIISWMEDGCRLPSASLAELLYDVSHGVSAAMR